MHKRILSICLLLLVLVACNDDTSQEQQDLVRDNPTPEEILSNNENADIFLLNGIVYSNAEDIEWVNEKELSVGKELGEIQKQTNNSVEFENFTASKLTVGTKIYETVKKNDILIAIVDDMEIRYLGLREG